MALVSAMHITAGVYVNDDERGLIQDIDQWLEQLAPFKEEYLHHETGEDNGDSHLKALACASSGGPAGDQWQAAAGNLAAGVLRGV